jgi:hypothetical protein
MTTLYRMFDVSQNLLYVGISARPLLGRLKEHGAAKSWWPEVAYLTVEHFPTRAEAAAAEVRAIRTEHPKYNQAHSRPKRPPENYSNAAQRLLAAFKAGERLSWEDLTFGKDVWTDEAARELLEEGVLIRHRVRNEPDWPAFDFELASNNLPEACPYGGCENHQDWGPDTHEQLRRDKERAERRRLGEHMFGWRW